MSGRGFLEPEYQAGAIDRALYRDHSRLTVGSSAFHQYDPSQITMEIEEFNPRRVAASERAALRCEIFGGFLEFLFADGPDPVQVLARVEGFIASFHPALAAKIVGEPEWVSVEAVAGVLRKHHVHLTRVNEAAASRGSLFSWFKALSDNEDSDFVNDTLIVLAEYLACEGLRRRRLVAVAYCLAKSLKPALIASMSLHDIAILSGDGGGRATPCNRIQRVYNHKLAAAGAKACQVHFQKSASVVAKYSDSQMGNTNRRGNGKRKLRN